MKSSQRVYALKAVANNFTTLPGDDDTWVVVDKNGNTLLVVPTFDEAYHVVHALKQQYADGYDKGVEDGISSMLDVVDDGYAGGYAEGYDKGVEDGTASINVVDERNNT